MRYCNFISHTHLQMYDGRAPSTHRARTLIARHGHDSTAGRNTSIRGNSANNRHGQQMQRAILRQGLSLGHHSSKHSPHARVKRAEDTPLHDAAESLQDKGTQAVSACSCEHMGSANARGSAHL